MIKLLYLVYYISLHNQNQKRKIKNQKIKNQKSKIQNSKIKNQKFKIQKKKIALFDQTVHRMIASTNHIKI